MKNTSYHKTVHEILKDLATTQAGLSTEEVSKRRLKFGSNQLPTHSAPNILTVFIRQFFNPLIYILVIVGIVSMAMGHMTDSFFIFGVLIFNAIIGTFQEYNAEKSAQALRDMTSSNAYVRRDGIEVEIQTIDLVPGDIVLLEAGDKTPADIRIINSKFLQMDESLLTGESLPVTKDDSIVLEGELPISDQSNMVFAGSLVTNGKATGVVTETAMNTQLGRIANAVLKGGTTQTPLLLRMEGFSQKVAILSALTIIILGIILIIQGYGFAEVLLLAVALGVAAIPEGLPIALTVTLSVASKRMSKLNVIVRKLAAVEALGSCTYIATDKTGTLTVNELTVKKITIPQHDPITVEGSGIVPEGKVCFASDTPSEIKQTIEQISIVGALCNSSQLVQLKNEWSAHGDAVDTALLVLSHKISPRIQEQLSGYEKIDEIPFSSERQYALVKHRDEDGKTLISVKGALEKLLPMCHQMHTPDGIRRLDPDFVEKQAIEMAENGERVLALAYGEQDDQLIFLCLVGMMDPLRPEAIQAIQSSHQAGVSVAMVTGDHPITAFAIAKELGLASSLDEVVTGKDLFEISQAEQLDQLVAKAKVFARVGPEQKMQIVESLIRQNHFVAVTGDGANDAPALKAAHVGVAMGMKGTDVAKETADLIITDDKFSSIIAGVEQGRIAYSNVRRVIYLVVSTGAAEIVLFLCSILFQLPVPLSAVQLLWLNMVTNGIQDVALAFEPGETDELSRSPRDPQEPIFDRMMIQRVLTSAIVMGGVSFLYFKQLIDSGTELLLAQNSTLLLMVLFENVMIGNARSERKSTFTISPLKNPILLIGTIFAQAIHIAAMHSPFFNKILGMRPISWQEWSKLLALALTVILAVEIQKMLSKKK